MQRVVQEAPEKHENTAESEVGGQKNQQYRVGVGNLQAEGLARYERRARCASERPESWIGAKWRRDGLAQTGQPQQGKGIGRSVQKGVQLAPERGEQAVETEPGRQINQQYSP